MGQEEDGVPKVSLIASHRYFKPPHRARRWRRTSDPDSCSGCVPADPVHGDSFVRSMAVLQSHADPSYAALGLLPSIPVSQGASSSRSQRVKLPFLPSSGDADEGDEDEIPTSAVVGYGRIIRDEEGNVIDIILPEDDETEPVSNAGKSGLAEHDEVEKERKVEAKTDVVRCECPCALVTVAPSRLSLRTLRVPHSKTPPPPLYFPPAGCPRLFVPRCPRGLWLGHFYSVQPLVLQLALLASLHV